MINYRYSKETDLDDISELLKICFGDRDNCGALDNLNHRYLLALDGTKLIAMTGLCEKDKSNYNGKEIDWTCCHPDYRNKHITTKLFEIILKDIKDNVYCSCWRLSNLDRVNLQGIMDRYNFKCVIKAHKVYKYPYTKACDICIINNGKNCICYEDLYLMQIS